MIASFRMHWRIYLMEFFGLAGFVFIAGLLTILLEHPDMPVMKTALKDYPLLRRIPLGIILGGYITVVVLLIGKKSGAHVNPAISWTFFRLGKINFTDLVFFTLAQVAGAVVASQILKHMLGQYFGHPSVHFGSTQPQPPHGSLAAFTAEFLISFGMMIMTLVMSSSRRFQKLIAPASGVLIAIYLMVETPFSGMSLNPARSFAGALAANKWEHLWIYFSAPVIAMLIAAELFIIWRSKQPGYRAIGEGSVPSTCIEHDYKEISRYPVEQSA